MPTKSRRDIPVGLQMVVDVSSVGEKDIFAVCGKTTQSPVRSGRPAR